MTEPGDGFTVRLDFRPFPGPLRDAWRANAFRRLDHAWHTAVTLPIDDQSRIVFISDCHRGDGSPVDRFAPNKALYHAALGHYFAAGFTYVENGDGDELWDNGRFADALTAHRDTFDLLHEFERAKRLYLLIGNHEMFDARRYLAVKDGLPTYHSLLLDHVNTGAALLVLHGHQGDLSDGGFYPVSRFLYRSILRRLHWRQHFRRSLDHETNRHAALDPAQSHSLFDSQGKRIAQVISEWIDDRRMPIVCGHTHLADFPARQATPYFNSGCCVYPGLLTCLELEHGALSLVKWFVDDHGRAGRELLAAPRSIASLLTG